jgi:hypothetical protein
VESVQALTNSSGTAGEVKDGGIHLPLLGRPMIKVDQGRRELLASFKRRHLFPALVETAQGDGANDQPRNATGAPANWRDKAGPDAA